MDSQNEIETTTPNGGVKYWLNELDESKKRDQDYHKEGARIVGIYECKDAQKVPFNILFSNTADLSAGIRVLSSPSIRFSISPPNSAS